MSHASRPHAMSSLYASIGMHQAVMAVFDVAQHPDRERELREAFDRMDTKICTSDVDATHGLQHGLKAVLYVAANALAIPRGEFDLDATATNHAQVLTQLSADMSADASEAIVLARESPTMHAFSNATGQRRKKGPLPHAVLLEAAVVVVRALVEHHGDPTPESWWFMLGQLFGSMCVTAP